MFLSGLFWLSSNMMQLDGRYFRSICSESVGKVEDTVIQTHMNTSHQNKMQIWIKSIDVSQYVRLPTFPPYREVGAPLHLTSSTLITVIGWQAISNLIVFEIDDGNYCAP